MRLVTLFRRALNVRQPRDISILPTIAADRHRRECKGCE